MDIIGDFATEDLDDMLALAFLCAHPTVNLLAVTVTPGSPAQIGVVREVLSRCERSGIPVGSFKPDHPHDSVNPFHYRLLGRVTPASPDARGHEVLARSLQQSPAATIVTGAPLSNLRAFLDNHPDTEIARWVGQGGFAGANVVPPQHQLPKLTGRITCPTFNFDGDIGAAHLLLSTPRVKLRHLVAKNVCHGVVYDNELQS
ncbi:MAG: nucleoside hydrolase [Planctomycetota bacterium]|nr:nucleoside hydrolase [Planctomycetota bacterium]